MFRRHFSRKRLFVRPISVHRKKHDIQVTDNGNDKRRHQGVSIRRPTLNYRHDRTADNRGTQHTGSRVGEFAQPFGCQRENRREHNRVEKTDGKQRPHRHIRIAAARRHRDGKQHDRSRCVKRQITVGANFAITAEPRKRPTIAPPQ